jgi:hypothetical protein
LVSGIANFVSLGKYFCKYYDNFPQLVWDDHETHAFVIRVRLCIWFWWLYLSLNLAVVTGVKWLKRPVNCGVGPAWCASPFVSMCHSKFFDERLLKARFN